MLQHNKNAALYCRLSRDDKNIGESDSIQNQEMALRQYAKLNGFQIVDTYKDDGFSGTSFDRPDFIRMMGDLRAKKADTIIVKDLSRFGREHIQADLYREIEFPQMGVRLIAINDNYDGAKADHSSNSMAQIKGLFNEWFAADTSEKVRRVLRSKAESGQYLAAAPYGYKKSPENKHKIIPAEETAPIVKRVFDMAAAGDSYKLIARTFTKEKILTPTACDPQRPSRNEPNLYEWSYSTIRQILQNPAYLGHTVYGRSMKVSYKVKKVVQQSADQWITVENTHEPLVSLDVWNIVQGSVTSRKRSTKGGEPHTFAGLVKCSDCGSTLTKNDRGRLRCKRYQLYGKEHCTNHHITLEQLTAAVLASIQAVSAEVRQDKDGFIERLSGVDAKQRQQKTNAARKERDKTAKRLAQLPSLMKAAFEQNASGKLPDDIYAEMMNGYKQEREDLTAKLDNLNAAIAEAEQESTGINEFVGLIEKYINIQELDRAVVHELIEKIVVHQAHKEPDGQRIQQIDIYYRFVGII